MWQVQETDNSSFWLDHSVQISNGIVDVARIMKPGHVMNAL